MPDAELSIKLSDSALKKIQGYASRSGVDVITYIRNSVQVMNALQEEKRARRRIYIGDSDRVYKELDVP